MAGRAKLLVDFIRRSRPVKINGFTVPVQTRCISSSVFVSHSQRTHSCGELRASHVGQDVVLCGWLMHERALQFITLKDAHGVTQFIVPDNKRDTLCEVVKGLKFESVLQVKGKVIRRPEGQENPKMPTGDIEVEIEDLKVLNPSLAELPFKTRDYEEITENVRLQYRYLDIRHYKMQKNLRIRSNMVMKMREFLCNKLGFVDVETPTLFRRTPGGAREFVVPTKMPGKFYCLPQSPQQFKQLLMVGGIDRYMQIAKCYRDEGAKTDRQPEFTQVDIEMSFVTQEDIMDVIEGLLVNSWPKESGVLKTPFPRMTYEDAMRQYGIDKPDTRFEMKIKEVTDIFQGQSVPVFAKALATPGCSIHALNIKTGQRHLSNKDIEKLQAFAKESKAELNLIPIKMKEDLSLQGSMAKFLSTDTRSRLITHLGMEPGDLVFLSAGETYATCALLGRVRLESTNSFDEEERRKLQDPSALNFLWVYDFPLFLPKEDGTEGLESAHHPFTAPQPGQEELLYTHPEKVQGQHYDLVLNGTEIGGGSIRIHNSQMQRYVLEEILKEDSSQLNHLLQALDSGCPPHGGIALGLDRLVAIACQANSIRDVIAFPKTSVGRDIMSDAPARISAEEQNYYHIKVTDDGT